MQFDRLGFPLIVLFLVTTVAAQNLPGEFDDWDPRDDNLKTGPAIGDRIPPFQAVDQTGQMLDFQAIKGPRGAMLLFFRSADW